MSAGVARAAIAAGAVILAVVVVLDAVGTHRRKARLHAGFNAVAAEPLPPPLARRIAREHDPADARLALARAVVARELRAARDPDGSDPALARLSFSRDLAAHAYRQRPASWQAPMLLGAANYVSRSLARDRRLVTEAAYWERPLSAALGLTESRSEPGRFLVTAYLELWPFLSPEKQRLTGELLRRAMSDSAGFLDLIDPWLEVTDDRSLAFDALPLEPFVWERMLDRYAGGDDWPAFLEALPYARQAEERELAELLGGAAQRRRGGELREARGLYFAATTLARPSAVNLPTLRQVVAETPPGPPPANIRPAFAAWFDWTVERCSVGRCPLAEPDLRRLAGFAGATDQEVDLALTAGDRPAPDPAEEWSAESWSWDGRYARLRWALAVPRRVEVEVASAPAAGAVVGVQIDGEDRGAFIARSGRWLRIEEPVAPGLHSLAFVTLGGRPIRPGRVRTRPPS